MSNEEIERLLRVVSDPLRIGWEKAKIESQSLLDYQRERESALALVKCNDKKSSLIVNLAIALGILFVAIITFPSPSNIIDPVWLLILAECVLLLSLIVSVSWVWHLNARTQTAQTSVMVCNAVFENFKRSTDSLNPLGTGNHYHDVITEQEIVAELTRLACRLLDAELKFDRRRLKPDAVRSDIIHLGNWVGRCQGQFDQVWNTATCDFALVLNKPAIFKAAAAELARNDPERAT